MYIMYKKLECTCQNSCECSKASRLCLPGMDEGRRGTLRYRAHSASMLRASRRYTVLEAPTRCASFAHKHQISTRISCKECD